MLRNPAPNYQKHDVMDLFYLIEDGVSKWRWNISLGDALQSRLCTEFEYFKNKKRLAVRPDINPHLHRLGQNSALMNKEESGMQMKNQDIMHTLIWLLHRPGKHELISWILGTFIFRPNILNSDLISAAKEWVKWLVNNIQFRHYSKLFRRTRNLAIGKVGDGAIDILIQKLEHNGEKWFDCANNKSAMYMNSGTRKFGTKFNLITFKLLDKNTVQTQNNENLM